MLGGSVALVTGAASGLGRAIAREFARQGARVAVTDLSLPAATRACDELAEETGAARSSLTPIAMDVTSEAQVGAGFDAAAEALGAVPNILVANAGIQHVRPLVDFELQDWRRVTEVHLDGSFLTAREAMRRLAAAPRDAAVPRRIIFVGSAHSAVASLNKSAYVAAKHGIVGLSRVVAKEAAALGATSNVICPGYVMTPLVRDQIPVSAKALGISEEEVVKRVMLGNTVDGEFTTEQDIADIAAFVASHKAKSLTGQSFHASHGWVMQ
jgi:3-hydroxybutyrate dehydrogenase